MAAADSGGGPGPDLYRQLGVPRGASQADIARAWRLRARAEHPDSRPGDPVAPDRFRALARAWHVLGDPARRAAYDQALARAAYDQALARERALAWRTPEPAVLAPSARMPASPPLWAGPVRVGSLPPPGPADRDEEIALALLAGLALRRLARYGDSPW